MILLPIPSVIIVYFVLVQNPLPLPIITHCILFVMFKTERTNHSAHLLNSYKLHWNFMMNLGVLKLIMMWNGWATLEKLTLDWQFEWFACFSFKWYKLALLIPSLCVGHMMTLYIYLNAIQNITINYWFVSTVITYIRCICNAHIHLNRNEHEMSNDGICFNQTTYLFDRTWYVTISI